MAVKVLQEFPDQFTVGNRGPCAFVVTPETGVAGLREVYMDKSPQFRKQEVAVHLPVLVKQGIEFLYDPGVFLYKKRLFFR